MDDNADTGKTMSEGSPMGTEASTMSSGIEGAGLSPEFMKMTHSLVDGASPEQLAYVQKCCDEAGQGSAEEENPSSTPEEYSTTDMPKD